MADVLIDFNEGRQLHRVQQARLGELATDDIGNTWSYVQFRQAVSIGDVVRDAKHPELVSGNANQTPAAEAATTDSDRLKAADDTFENIDVRGAIGAIVTGTGYGQNFIVVDKIDDETLQVRVLTSQTNFEITNGTWQAALKSTSGGSGISNFRLAFPGAVYQGNGLTDNVRGFSQVEVETGDVGRYGWVQQTGIGFVKLDASNTAVPVIGEGLVQAGSGLVRGLTAAATTADDAANIIAKSLLGDYGPATSPANTLMWAELCVVNRAQSYRLPHELHPFAQPGQRI